MAVSYTHLDEVTGSESGAHGLKRLEIRHEMSSVFRSQGPEVFVLNNIEAQVPCFGAVFI